MRPLREAIGLIGVAVLGLATVVAPPARRRLRGPRGLPGIIVFQRADADDQWQLWVANADLTNQRQITSGPYTTGFAPGSRTERASPSTPTVPTRT